MSIRIGQQLGSYEITATHSSGKAKAVHGTHFSTSLARMISLSLLSSGNFSTRHVATINRSAGVSMEGLGKRRNFNGNGSRDRLDPHRAWMSRRP